MSIPAAYIGVIIIWSTTPLAITWSGESVGFQFGITARMLIGAFVGLCLMALLRTPLPMHRRAWQVYLLTGVTIFMAMSSVYWAAQQIPSGWISVIFGLSPIVTGVAAGLLLGERLLGPVHVSGLLLGLGGLGMIFSGGLELGGSAVPGILAVLFSVLVHSSSSVLVKRLARDLPALAITVGGLLISSILLLLTMWLSGVPMPEHIPARVSGAILYLGVVGSVFGFAMYYYVLKHVAATRVALLTLMTPVLALWLGHLFNDEPLKQQVLWGTGSILSGLALFELGPRYLAFRTAKS